MTRNYILISCIGQSNNGKNLNKIYSLLYISINTNLQLQFGFSDIIFMKFAFRI